MEDFFVYTLTRRNTVVVFIEKKGNVEGIFLNELKHHKNKVPVSILSNFFIHCLTYRDAFASFSSWVLTVVMARVVAVVTVFMV